MFTFDWHIDALARHEHSCVPLAYCYSVFLFMRYLSMFGTLLCCCYNVDSFRLVQMGGYQLSDLKMPERNQDDGHSGAFATISNSCTFLLSFPVFSLESKVAFG